jgi:topoisomerase-4 subunit A
MVSRLKAGKSFMTLDDGAQPLAPMPMWAGATQVACLSDDGRLLVFGMDEMKSLSGGGRGVTLIALEGKEKLTQATPIGAAGVVLVGAGRGGKPTEVVLSRAALAPHIGKRARKGRKPEARLKIESLRPAL